MSTGNFMRRRTFARWLPGALALCALLGLNMLISGCGVITPTTGSSPNGTSPTGTSASASATATARANGPTPATTQPPNGPAGAVPCPMSGQSPGQPALILTPTTHNHTGSAHVGDMVQVRLPLSEKWVYEQQPTGPLTPAQPSGVLIHAVNACVWTFQATATGSQALHFEGQQICRSEQPCALYRIAIVFTVTVV